MSAREERNRTMFTTLKAMFPHVDLTIVSENMSFSQNLQNLVAQLGTPAVNETKTQIFNMKSALDQQQLKIQTTLVNSEDDVLGNITNRVNRRDRQEKGKPIFSMESIEEEESQFWQNDQNHFRGENVQNHDDRAEDSMSDIWEFGTQNHKDWFHH